MKRLYNRILVGVSALFVLFLLCFSSCVRKGNPVEVAADGKVVVTATIFPPYDFVRQIAGDKVSLKMLLPPGAESHSFEPTPQDIIAIQRSKLFIYGGGESDEWVERILESMDVSAMKLVSLMDCVDVVEEEIVEGMQAEKEAQSAFKSIGVTTSPEYDEHVWTSPKNVVRIVRVITDALCEIDVANAEVYRQNAVAYTAKLDALDEEFQAVVTNGSRRTIVFGDRFPFRYFADAYGLAYFAAFPGCSTDTEPSAATVAFLIDKVKTEQIPVIFHIELSNERMADIIAESTGAEKLLLHACHNISKRDFDAGKTYLDFMQANVKSLQTSL
ncbi:MAG: metal ABC transporter substrate-binding protein [Treponema sp.]|jgi:zinc transport system substrate-binding protein|nr:metal ABC transporter substrate-binding protein [Treponema sp.]